MDISIGKFTLESLTTGMYADARIVYREYIQNAVDSLEAAVKRRLIEPSGMRIDIVVSAGRRAISVRDNGVGLGAEEVPHTLLSIGSSSKRHTQNRGFRGIGRLGGMSYCDTLSFTTTCEGENTAATVRFDCRRLREMLLPGLHESLDLSAVLSAVTEITHKPEAGSKHYFLVEMEGVDPMSGLLDVEDIRDYIAQTAPLPYRSRLFSHTREIHQYTERSGYTIEEFPIFFGTQERDLEPLYKPNRDRYHSGRSKKRPDELLEVRCFSVKTGGTVCAVGWYGAGSWYGMISEPSLRGLRVRKGNILIGDAKMLNSIFKEPRFNGWVQGEVFVLSEELVPNARRDDFERSAPYFAFIEALSGEIGQEISALIREASRRRSDPGAKALLDAKKKTAGAETALAEGFHSPVERTDTLESLNQAKRALCTVSIPPTQLESKKALAAQLDTAAKGVAAGRNYKWNQANVALSRESARILEIVSDVLSQNLSKFLVDAIIDEIIDALERE